MACHPINLGGGVTGVFCNRGERAKPCSVPGCRNTGTRLCDFPVTRKGKAGTCSARLCGTHASSGGKDLDYCPPHAKATATQGTLW